MEHEAAHNFRIGERNDHLRGPRLAILERRDTEGIAQAIEIHRNTIDLRHQESGLMNMEVVILRISSPP